MALALNYTSGFQPINSATGLPDIGTSSSFTPPLGSLVFVTAFSNTNIDSVATITNTGGGLTSWTLVKSAGHTGGTDGAVYVWYARVTTSIATTVTVQIDPGRQNNRIESGLLVDVWTGAKASQAGGATSSNDYTLTNAFVGSVTTTAPNSVVALSGVTASGAGPFYSTDALSSYELSGQGDGVRAYTAILPVSGTTPTITVNCLGADGLAWVTYEILEESASTAPGNALKLEDLSGGFQLQDGASFLITDTGPTLQGRPLLEDGSSRFLLENGTTTFVFEGGPFTGGTTYPGYLKIWSGAAWVYKPAKVWTGSSWVQKPVKFRTAGGTWQTTNGI